MASITAMAQRKGETDSRAQVALAALAERSGTTAPEVGGGRLTDHSHYEAARIVAESAVVAFLAEQLVALAAEVDALKKKGEQVMATIEQAVSRRQAEFVAKTLRMPTSEEARELRQVRTGGLAQEAGERREAELQRAYLGQAGATLESWEREKAAILVSDRADRTKRAEAEARAASSQRYRGF